MPDDRPRATGLRKVHVTGAVAPAARPPLAPPTERNEPALGSSPPASTSPLAPAASAADAATADRLQADLAEQAVHALKLVARIESTLRDAVPDAVAAAREGADSAGRAAADRRVEQMRALDASVRDEQAATLARLAGTAIELAPGAASFGWGDDWSVDEGGRATHLRYGGKLVGKIPAIAPFLDASGWVLDGDERPARELAQATIARVVARIPARHLRVVVFDPKLRGTFGVFAKLRTVDAAAFASPATTSDQLKELLDGVIATASGNAELLAANNAPDVNSLWDVNGTPLGAVIVVVVLDYPVGLDEASHVLLERLAESAAQRGVTILLQTGDSAPAKGVHPKALRGHLVELTYAGGAWTSPALPADLLAAHDGPIPAALVEGIVQRVIDRSTSTTGPTVDFADLLGDLSAPWSESSADALVATIGRAGREPVTVSLRSANPASPNMLVGGAVGQGKSNLLLDVIYSLAARYSPDELELLLLDFKLGLEFKRFDADPDGRNWLPHVRVLSLESNKDFGLAVLDHVLAELARRSELFKAVRANSIAEYRDLSGKTMPRMLLIVDEFQMLFDGDDDVTATAVARLDQLAKQGRAFGIHLLLSSQTVSGISGLRVKGDGIFAQFPLRVSLKNTADESQAILSRQNTAAAELSYRGEFVLNRNFGIDAEAFNERGIAAFADPAFVAPLQARLWERAGATVRPLVFLGRDFAIRPAAWPQGSTSVTLAAVGMPIAITSEPETVRITRDVDQGVALVGTGDHEARAVISAAVDSMLAQLAPSTRLLVLDAESEGDAPEQWIAELLARASARGVRASRAARTEIVDALLGDVAATLADTASTPVLVVGIALQRVAGLTEERSLDPDADFSLETISAASVLRDLGARGGLRDALLIAWWSTLRSFHQAVGYDHEGIGTLIVLGTNPDDRRSLVGRELAVEGSPRATVVQLSGSVPPRIIVPFEGNPPA